ncbi:MAG: hypothetical protein HC834_02735 [Rhodospirillales bacterium]|nr:hypothetical protein [Rhodospirillales bacterium]
MQIFLILVAPQKQNSASLTGGATGCESMPYLRPGDMQRLLGGFAETENARLLDLRGLDGRDAVRRLEEFLLSNDGMSGDTVRIAIDSATASSGETAFLPVGRFLLHARRCGLISSLAPSSKVPGGGFVITLPPQRLVNDD